ncbi:ubiquitin carboxyl-terminal hydrolase 10-like [Mizuhopecten yessoensis]|uniref:ubiquitinyl hydrolase 1 n=1 Tax=Mizuhopecten yessoensis TaxID=6573 RepID=A0A210PNC4_MIZYE|nr:ubiquitin carboxyl-terminal hydrolase 10-like [Mizuhopecten yessoensis]OWF38010.1 Ubiquitin carboxyl-terminal hydrolase 10-B [Mizuhopecten yessoensis]
MAYQTQDLTFGDFDTLDQHEQNNIRKILYGPRSSTGDRKVEFPWDESRGSMFQNDTAQGGDMVAPPETNCMPVNMNTDPIPNYQHYHSDGPPQQQYQQHMEVIHEQMNSQENEEYRQAYQEGQQDEFYGNQFPREDQTYRASSVEFGYDPSQSEMSQGGGKQRRNKKKRPPGYYEKLEEAERKSQTDLVQSNVGNWADSAIGQVSPQNFSFMPLNYPPVPAEVRHMGSPVSQHTPPPYHEQRPPGIGMVPPSVQERPFPQQGAPPAMVRVHPSQTMHQGSIPQQDPAVMATGNAPDARHGGSLPREGAHLGTVNNPQILREASLPREEARMGIMDQSQTYRETSFPSHGPPPPMGNMAMGSYPTPVQQNINRNMSSVPPSRQNPAVNYTYSSSPQASHHMDQGSHNVPPENSSTSYLPQHISNPQTVQHLTNPPVDRELENVSHQMSDLSVSQNTRGENPSYAHHHQHHHHQGPQTDNTVYNSNNVIPVMENKPADSNTGVRVNRPPGFNAPSYHLNQSVAAAVSLNSIDFNIQDNYEKQPSPPRNTPTVQADQQVVPPSEQYIVNVQLGEPNQTVGESDRQVIEPVHQVSESVHQTKPEPIIESVNSDYSNVVNELPDSSDVNTVQQGSGDLKLANVSSPSLPIQSEQPKPVKAPTWAGLFKNVTPPTSGPVAYSVTHVDTSPPPSEVKQNVTKDMNVPNDPVSTEDDKLARNFGEALSIMTVSHVQVGLTPRGLVNRGNWCYINATLQALVACPPFCDLLRRMPKYNREERGPSSTPVLDCMVEFVNEFSPYVRNTDRGSQKGRRMYQDISTGKEFEPVNVYKMLQVMQANQTFKLGRQEDAEEFLSCILDGLHEEMASVMQLVNNTRDSTPETEANGFDQEEDAESEMSEDSWEQVGPKKRSALTRKAMFSKSPIADIFVGYMRSAVFKSAAKESATLQPFFTLQLDIQADTVHTVRDALEGLVLKESISGYTCTKTKLELEVAKKVTLEELPPVLVMHLKYFVFNKDGGSQKLLKKIDYPIDLEITRDLLSPNVKSKLQLHQRSYKLFAVVFHHGKMATGGGHYTTTVFHPAINGWISLDDNSVKPVNLPFVLKYNPPRVPYLLYYRRTDVH